MGQVEIHVGDKWERHSGTLEVLAETRKGYRVQVTWNNGEVKTSDVESWEVQKWAQNSLSEK